MKVYTSYFANLKNLKNQGLVIISIARYMPRFLTGYERSEIKEYTDLAPTSDMLRMNEGEYRPKFEMITKRLNIKKVLADFEALGKGQDVVMLCYERPGDFCHRTMVADWMKKQGVNVTEYKCPPPKVKDQTISMF